MTQLHTKIWLSQDWHLPAYEQYNIAHLAYQAQLERYNIKEPPPHNMDLHQ